MDCSLPAPHPWDFPGKNTGVSCPLLLQNISVNDLHFPLLILFNNRLIKIIEMVFIIPITRSAIRLRIKLKMLLLIYEEPGGLQPTGGQRVGHDSSAI